MTDFPITIDVIASSYLPVTLEILSGDASINGQEITVNKAGTIELKASQVGNENHEPAHEEIISFSVSKADQEIIFSEITDKSMLEFPYTLEVISTGNLPVTFELVKGSASITNNVINVVEAGEIKIKTSQLGNDFYNSAEEKIISFNTYKANQDLVLSEIDTKTSSDSPFEIKYTSSISNNIIYNVSGPVNIDNGFVHLIGESGTIELSALQEATSIYNSGSDTISFEVINSNSEITNIENISSIYTVYPNPTTDFLIIKGVQNKSKIELIGLLGNQFTAKIKHNTLDVRNLPMGTYFLIIDGVKKLRFIKN
ncbi:T9SS type A sorting domain-containing protein [Flammeovirga pectinis]|uniref:T9SS type A sorting domain-containing protein n=1 Tax=Flammeovirga pectinis TaxID=2494373 RepID=A0A3S9PAC3_9BACT|nr:T9SS type A sorting domain-containing protein [Flammeovirga pectinis]AZQ65117.1 T9SS type A sorting domain-containing protein [Flammeovirga pectinis]